MARQKLEVTITGDADGAKRAFKETDDAAKRSERNVGDSFDGAGKSSDRFGGKMDDLKGKAGDWGKDIAIGIGAGAGALAAGLLVKGFTDFMDRESGQAKLGIQLGLTPEMAKAAGSVAGEIYGDAFGDSLGTVNDAVASVTKNIGGLGNISKDEFKDITKGVLTIAETFDQDLNRVTAAAGTILKTGLAPDAKTALDVLTVGLQGPANKADDLLDVFMEYSTVFRSLGLDSETALGIMKQGLENGAYTADQVADSLLSFSERAKDGSKSTTDAFDAIGLNFFEMGAKVAAGGSEATEALKLTIDALNRVENPALRAQYAAMLFGDQANTMQGALYSIDPTTAVEGIGQVEGAMTRATDATSTNSAKVEEWKRGMETNVVNFISESLIPGMESMAGQWRGNSGLVNDFHTGLINLGDGFRFLKDEVIDPFVGTLQTLWGWLDTVIKKIHDFDWAVQLTGPASAAISAGGGAGDFAKTIGGPLGILAEGLGFDDGGVIPGPKGSPKLILAHSGETVLPTHKMSAAQALTSAFMQFEDGSTAYKDPETWYGGQAGLQFMKFNQMPTGSSAPAAPSGMRLMQFEDGSSKYANPDEWYGGAPSMSESDAAALRYITAMQQQAGVQVVINNANTLVAQADLSRQIETAVRQAQRTGTGILA